VSPKNLNRIELGHGNPTAGTLLALAGALGVTLGELMRAAETGQPAGPGVVPTSLGTL
jgi:transcriptional regulator with XRE-family HTH domain